MSGKHHRRLTNPAQVTVYDLAPHHAPRRAPWPIRFMKAVGRFLFVTFIVIFGDEEEESPSHA